MKTETIQIIDRGRGAQLSTSRVTVQDLVPYFQEGCSHEEIIRWIPTLTPEEIAVVEGYYRDHQEELDEEDRQICERNASRENPTWVSEMLHEARAERLAITERLRQEQDGRAQVTGILADINIQGQIDLLVVRMRHEPWKLFWEHLDLRYVHFDDLGLAQDSPDSLVWETCQREELILLTDNRNKNNADSLEETIRVRNTPTSLPVFTIGNVRTLRSSRDYADRVIDTLLDSLQRIDLLRGTGRLYLP